MLAGVWVCGFYRRNLSFAPATGAFSNMAFVLVFCISYLIKKSAVKCNPEGQASGAVRGTEAEDCGTQFFPDRRSGKNNFP